MVCDWCGEELTFWTTKMVTLRGKGLVHNGKSLSEVTYRMHVSCAAKVENMTKQIASEMRR